MNSALRSETPRCPSCGASGHALLTGGLCARCLLGAALDFDATFALETDELAADTPRQVGRYRLLGEIDRGGVGVVYRAWQADLRREVALKMLLPARLDTNGARERFRREAKVMAGLDHAGILPVYEVGVENGRPYFSMKLAEGGNLAEHIPGLRGKFRECARLVAAIARAIAHAHARGVLHRDLKPSNIVFDGAGQPLVTDFGLARFLAEDSTLTGADALIGTPRYTAPEVVTTGGARLTPAADVYGLGAILYELLCGRPPFAELTSLQVLQQIATRRPRLPRQIDSAIPAALEVICLRCLEKRPADRYASADALADALETWLAEADPTTLSRLRAWSIDVPSRRRRTAIVTALALASVLVAAAAWYATREPIPIPDPVIATRTVAVMPNLLRNDPSEEEAARRIAERLKLPPPLRVLPFDETLPIGKAHNTGTDTDVDAATGAFLIVALAAQDTAGTFALLVGDDLREERLYETIYTRADEDRVVREIAATLTSKRQQPTAEAHLSRRALASLLRAIRWLEYPGGEGTNEKAIAALKDVIGLAPDSAVAHAWLSHAYQQHGGDAFWVDSAIDEAARAQRMDPSLGLATKQLGMAYQQKGWFARAMTTYEQAQAQGSLFVEEPLSWIYYNRGRYKDAYVATLERKRFGTDDLFPEVMIAQILFTVGADDAGERAMKKVIAADPRPSFRTLRDAEIAWYRGDYRTCRERAARIEPQAPELYDGYFTPTGLVRACAIEQGDFAAALATMEVSKRGQSGNTGASSAGISEALREAILLAQLNRNADVPALLAQARQSLQAAIDASSDYPPVWLRMAAAQRVAGEIDASYATLEHAIAIGLTINHRNRGDVEFLPFRDDARFATLRVQSESHLAEQRRAIDELLKFDAPDPRSEVGQDRPAAGPNEPP